MTRKIINIMTTVVATIFVLGCGGSSSGGSDCTIETADDGTITITCGDETTTIPSADSQDGANGQDGQGGTDGADGQGGADGADGQTGADGADGQDGADGADGDAGAAGQDGSDGDAGDAGQDGSDGQDGEECTVAENGDGTTTQTCPDGSTNTWWTGFSGRVFYRADLDDDGYYHAYMAEVQGGTPTSYQLSAEPAGSGGVVEYKVSDDGNTLVYRGDIDVYQQDEVYYVDLSGASPATPVKLNPSLTTVRDIRDIALSANGESLVYAGNQDSDNVSEAYYVDLSGASPAAPVKISGTMVLNGSVFTKAQMQISDDGNRTLYLADQDTDGVLEVYYVNLAGASPAAPVKISGTMVAGGSVSSSPALAADGRAALYKADQETNDKFELYYVDLSGASPAAPVKLNTALPTGADVIGFSISRDSQTVIYSADQDINDTTELYYVDLSGPSPASPVKLNTTFPTDGDISSFRLSRDGSVLTYYADQDVNNDLELFYVDLSGASPTAPVQVNDALIVDGDVQGYRRISADGQAVVYQADKETDDVFEIYYVDMSAGEPGVSIKLNTGLPTDADVDYLELSEDGDTVVYIADQDIYNKREIYLVSITPNGQHTAPLKLNEPIIDTNGNGIYAIEIRPI
ncbi:MAG: hypothetical protein GY854_27970 [Deltaproteobacteria bacterium]|nr:hypothetical protein [Deltaproteobacteria bacterium]